MDLTLRSYKMRL